MLKQDWFQVAVVGQRTLGKALRFKEAMVDWSIGHCAKPRKWNDTGLGITWCTRCNHNIFPDRAHDSNEGWICRDVERSCFYSKTKRF